MTRLMDARVATDRELAKRLLSQFDMEVGDLVYIEEETQFERRGYIGEILFAYCTNAGAVCVTHRGRSGWAPGSGSACIIASGTRQWSRVVRKLDRDDRATLDGSQWSMSNGHPLNWRTVR